MESGGLWGWGLHLPEAAPSLSGPLVPQLQSGLTTVSGLRTWSAQLFWKEPQVEARARGIQAGLGHEQRLRGRGLARGVGSRVENSGGY